MPVTAADLARWALFLDFDGTLVDLAPRPDAVVVAPALPGLLAALAARCGGAVALLSGRSIAALDRYLAPLVLPAAGQHGLERRTADGTLTAAALDRPGYIAMAEALSRLVEHHPGLVLERKSLTLCCHYRQRPDLQPMVRATVERLAADHPAFAVQPAKMAYEIKPKGADKGTALAAFLAEAPFRGRRALYAGDDLTDEAAFAAVNRLGGLSIKLGGGPTLARRRLAGPAALHDWLREAARSGHGPPHGLVPAPPGRYLYDDQSQ